MSAGRGRSAVVTVLAALLVMGSIGLVTGLYAALMRATPPRPGSAPGPEARSPRERPGRVPNGAATPGRGGTRVEVPLSDPVPRRLPIEGPPPGWTLHEFAGRADIELSRADAGLALRLRAAQGSFALVREVIVDLAVTPVLSWQWKLARAPAGGDVRDPAADDQAVQVYVIFPRWPSPMTRSEVLGYVWDAQAPVGTTVANPRAPNVRVVVVESGTGHAGQWRRASRNVREDFRALFRRTPPQVGAVALMTDADDTRTASEALVADLAFSSEPR